MDLIPQNWIDTAATVGEKALTVLAVVCVLGAVGLFLRYPMRYLYHQLRILYLGPIQWTEIVFEGGVSEADMVSAAGLVENQAKMMDQALGGVFKFYFPRPMTSVAIRVSPEDDTVHLYYGMDKRHHSPEQIANWAAEAGCSAEEVPDNDIGIVAKAPASMIVAGHDPINITDAPLNSSVGKVVSNLQASAARRHGTVVMTYEPMRESEENLLRGHIEDQAEMVHDHNSRFDGTPKALSILTSKSPSRGTITAFSDSGQVKSSRAMLKEAKSAMSNLGVRVQYVTPAAIHRRMSLKAIPMLIILAALSYFWNLSWYVTGAVVALFLGSMLGLGFMSGLWISLAARKGAVPIPPFFWQSLRRHWDQQWVRLKSRGREELRRYTGAPSCVEVIPLYQTSVMQFASMPPAGTASSNVASSAVPQVAMQTSAVLDTEAQAASGDVIYEGLSAKSYAPVYRTWADLNYGIAFGGEPGSGKTNALQSSFLGMCRLARKSTGEMADKTINPIWFETKTDDVAELHALAEPYDPLFVRVHDRDRPARLALEGGRIGDEGVTLKTIRENKNQMITAMAALWGDSFGPQSRQVADAALSVAMMLDRDGVLAVIGGQSPSDSREFAVAHRIGDVDRPNIIKLMYLLIGGDPSLTIDKSLEAYARTLREVVSNRNESARVEAERGADELRRIHSLVGAMDSLINLHGTNRGDAVKPLQNKIPRLLGSDGLFETTTSDGQRRTEYPLDRFLTYGGPVILDMTPSGSELSQDDSRLFVMMIHYMIWQRLQRIAGGWAAQGRYTPLYADEITNFTGDVNDASDCQRVITEVRDQGRSYGVSHNVGFQRFDQLPPNVISAVMSFPSKVFLKFENMSDATKVLEQLGERTRYAPENVRNFPRGIGIASMYIAGRSRPPFTIRFPYVGTWATALSNSGGDIRDAFDEIYDAEMAVVKNEKKRKIIRDTRTDLDRGYRSEDVPLSQMPVDDDLDSLFQADEYEAEAGPTWS